MKPFEEIEKILRERIKQLDYARMDAPLSKLRKALALILEARKLLEEM